MSTTHRILIVDGEPSIRSGLRTVLAGLGFEIIEAARGKEALSLVRTSPFDAVLLDADMPGVSGLETCRQMRQHLAGIAILVVTVSASQDGTEGALEAGADDYLTTPCNLRELVARLQAAIRRAQLSEGGTSEEVMAIGDLELDTERRLLLKAGRHIHLTPKEFDLLRCLMSNAGRPLRHERLLKMVWGVKYQGELEYLRTFVRQIRKKIEDDPARPRYLLTDARVGYRFVAKL